MKTILFILVACFISSLLYSTILNVPADYATIQAGIIFAGVNDTVLVQPGTYVENLDYYGQQITVGSLFLTTQDTSYISSTIIDGDSIGSVVTFETGEDSTAVLTGFTITNGYNVWGGGIYCYSSSPKLQNLIITGNSTLWGGGVGGGIYCWDSNLNLENLIITNNSADQGGGIYCCLYSNLYLWNVTISYNSASWRGGGIACSNTNLWLENVIINNNSANDGGGVWGEDSDLIFENVTITGNSGTGLGDGIYLTFSDMSIINSILWNNQPEEIFNEVSSVTATYSDIQGGWAGTGNINRDPFFVDPDNDNFNLTYDSPCVDTGDPTSPLDPDGTRADMGALYLNYKPNAEFMIDTTGGYAPLVVNFTDLSTQGLTIIDEWLWDFGDGNNSSLQNPANEYQLPGIYTVSLTVTDEYDFIDTETKVDYITVFGNDPPAPPTDVEVNIVYPDAIISWCAVDTTIIGDPALIGGYVVRYNETGYTGDEYFYFLAFTTEPIYTHEFVAQYSTQMFYQIIAITDISREEMKYLKGLNDSHHKIRWLDVKRILKKRNSLRS